MDKPKPNIDKVIQRVIIGLFGIGITCIIIFAGLSIFFLSPVDSSYEGYVEFKVEAGWGRARIADELREAGLIRSSFFFRAYTLIDSRDLFAGTFRISQNMSVYEIIRELSSMNALENETVRITFIEGRRLTDYARRIATTFEKDEQQILARLADREFLEELVERYWFLTDEIFTEGIKYPLEGYLFPDTYDFRVNSTIDDIIHRMLQNMGSRLEPFQNEITLSGRSVHEILTLAAIVELEVPRVEERAMVAGLINNRLRIGEPLGMDVTAHYAVGTELRDELTNAQLNVCSPFNTRGTCAIRGLPIGPIASPSLASITAAVEPEVHEYIFFVTDRNMRVYYTRTYAEHTAMIRQLIDQGLWYTFGR